MGKAIDLLEIALIAIVDDENLMLKDDFMMSIFKLITDVVPEFEEYLDYMLGQEQTLTIIKHQSNINKFYNSKVLLYYDCCVLNYSTQNEKRIKLLILCALVWLCN